MHFPRKREKTQKIQKITYGNDEGHTKELPPHRSFDFIQKIIESCAQMFEDQSEFGQGAIEYIVVVLDDFVPMLFPVLPSGTGQEQMCQIRGGR